MVVVVVVVRMLGNSVHISHGQVSRDSGVEAEDIQSPKIHIRDMQVSERKSIVKERLWC